MSKSRLHLYEISSDYIRAMDKLVTQFEDKKEHEEFIYDLQDNFEDKAINVAKYVMTLEAEANAIKSAADAMMSRYKSVSKNASDLKDYLRYHIEKTGLLDEIKSPECNIKLALNPPKLVIFDADLIPDCYKQVVETIKIDQAEIKKDIKDGLDVEGCKIVQEKRVVIK